MNRIVKHVYFLRYLSVTSSYQRRHLLQTATSEQLNVLYEIALNVLEGNISLNSQDFARLYKHRNVLRKLALKQVDRYTKRQLLGKHSCAIKDLLSIFFHYFPPEYLDESATSVQENRRKEEEDEEEETDEELVAENQLHESSSENSEEYKDGREQLVSYINPYSSVTLSTATAEPEVTDSRREYSESEGNDSHGNTCTRPESEKQESPGV